MPGPRSNEEYLLRGLGILRFGLPRLAIASLMVTRHCKSPSPDGARTRTGPSPIPPTAKLPEGSVSIRARMSFLSPAPGTEALARASAHPAFVRLLSFGTPSVG